MTYEEFCDELLRRLEGNKENLGYDEVQYYKDGFTSEDPKELSIIRDTNIKYHKIESDLLIGDYVILTVRKKYGQICRFDCKYLYNSYDKNGWEDVWEIINFNLAVSKKKDMMSTMELIDKNEYEPLKEKIFIRPLNYTDHRYELKDNIYKRIGDIVLVLYMLLSDENIGERHNVMSTKIPKSMVKNWGLPEDEVWNNAMINTYIMAPPRMFLNSMDLYKPSYDKGAFMALNTTIKSLKATQVPTITTTKQMNGAIAMFYPGVKERIAELFGGDYYIAFTSIHDVRVHKKGTVPPINILRNLKGINKNFPSDEILSRKVYLYEAASNELKQLEL